MKSIKQFFDEYASATLNGNANEVAGFYAETFMVSSKKNSAAFHNDQKFIEWLNGLFEFNKKTGLQKMEVSEVDAIPVGKHFTKATVTWASTFAKIPDEKTTFDIHYLLNHFESNPKIILYISEVDQENLMKEKGLL